MEAVDVGVRAAKLAGQLILQHATGPLQVRLKGPQDPVTEVDVLAEGLIRREIAEAFPDDEVLGEETLKGSRDAERLWVIDPLDGTRNYTVGLPFFCVSIALTIQRRPVLGVIHDPLRDETFVAARGTGAFVNGRRLHPLAPKSVEQAVVHVGFLPASNPRNPNLAIPVFLRLRPVIAAMRNLGSAALSLAYVACGRLDVALHDGLSPWDMLAAAVILEEAGGIITDFAGLGLSTHSTSVVAAGAQPLHRYVLDIAQEIIEGTVHTT